MNPRSFLSVVELRTNDPLAVSVYVEVDGAGRDDTNQIRSKAFEESSPALCLGDLPQDLSCFADVEQGAAGK